MVLSEKLAALRKEHGYSQLYGASQRIPPGHLPVGGGQFCPLHGKPDGTQPPVRGVPG